MRVLIVEDQPELRQLLRRQVEALGFFADEATNRQDGLAMLFGDSEIAVVILDLGLPPKADDYEEGLIFLKTVQEKNSLAKIIVLTGQSSPVVTMRAIEQGAFDYLEKPVDRQALHYALQRAMLFRDTHASLREDARVSVHIVADAATELNTKALRDEPMKKLIMSLLEKNNFNISATARELNMSREHLYYYLKKNIRFNGPKRTGCKEFLHCKNSSLGSNPKASQTPSFNLSSGGLYALLAARHCWRHHHQPAGHCARHPGSKQFCEL